jgi:hypothetical protein
MKHGGRAKGTPNKITSELKEALSNLVCKHLLTDIESLPPNKRYEALIRILPYVMPTAKETVTEPTYIQPLVITRTVRI